MSRILRPIPSGSAHRKVWNVIVDGKVIGNVWSHRSGGFEIQFIESHRRRFTAHMVATGTSWHHRWDTPQAAAAFLADALATESVANPFRRGARVMVDGMGSGSIISRADNLPRMWTVRLDESRDGRDEWTVRESDMSAI